MCSGCASRLPTRRLTTGHFSSAIPDLLRNLGVIDRRQLAAPTLIGDVPIRSTNNELVHRLHQRVTDRRVVLPHDAMALQLWDGARRAALQANLPARAVASGSTTA